MATMQRQKPPIELVRPSFYGMLICYYSAILGYGITAYLFGVLSIQHTVGAGFATAWAVALGCGALIAGAGVVFALWLRTHWLEIVGTITIVALMVGYAVAITLYALRPGGDPTRLSAFWLPIVIMVLPFWRMSVMASDGSLSLGRFQRAK